MKSDKDEAVLGVTETPASTRRWFTEPGLTWPGSRVAPQSPQCPHFPEPGHGQVILRRHFIDVQSCDGSAVSAWMTSSGHKVVTFAALYLRSASILI